jgi:hypothetical protein
MAQFPNNQLVPATFDNATKLFRVTGQDHIGVVTYGAGAIGEIEPRTAHSFIPELEAELAGSGRLSVEEFSQRLSDFFAVRWQQGNMPANADPAIFVIGGFDEGGTYGRVYQVVIPAAPQPQEQNAGEFGITFGGQTETMNRILHGHDPQLPGLLATALKLTATQQNDLGAVLKGQTVQIPIQFLPLQDCVDIAVFMIETTSALQRWQVGIRGVGGPIDVATITRIDGFRAVQEKVIHGK